MDLPKQIIRVLCHFEGAFSERVWEWAKVLLIGAILVPGERTVAAILRVMGQENEKQFQNYHRVLNRAKWSSRGVSHILLLLLVTLFMKAQDPVVVGIDETIERRRGEQIEARGIYRDPVRSSKKVVVKTSGLRWISMMLLTQVPWAKRIWALPFLTVLAPSERYHKEHKKRHKTITDWARQMVYQLHRWLPKRALVIVGDGSYAALKFLAAISRLPGVCAITPVRWDAALYDPAPERTSHTKGPRAKKGKRQPSLAERLVDPKTVWQKITVNWYGGVMREVEVATDTAIWYRSGMPLVPIRWVIIRDPEGNFESRALLCTDQDADPAQIIGWFVLRWQVEVTFHEVRAHLGVETQRQWSDLAILRTTPALLGLFSLVTIFAHQLLGEQPFPVRQAAWYSKALPTFSDTLAFVRQRLWPVSCISMSSSQDDMIEIPRALFERIIDALAFTG